MYSRLQFRTIYRLIKDRQREISILRILSINLKSYNIYYVTDYVILPIHSKFKR